jgi:hypothetical protein
MSGFLRRFLRRAPIRRVPKTEMRVALLNAVPMWRPGRGAS